MEIKKYLYIFSVFKIQKTHYKTIITTYLFYIISLTKYFKLEDQITLYIKGHLIIACLFLLLLLKLTIKINI
jgi:hypothetical protein